MPILMILLLVVLVPVQIFFQIQLTEVAIHVLNPGAKGFMVTANPFAWIIAFLLMVIIAAVARFLIRLLNDLVSIIVGLIVAIPFGKRADDVIFPAVIVTGIIVLLGWIVAAFPLTGMLMGHFEANPQLNGWLADGSWLAYVLVYLGILGIVIPDNFSKN